MRLLLLPGMDGTGQLFGRFSAAFVREAQIDVMSYAGDEALGYDALFPRVLQRLQDGPIEETVIIAESFSGPIAIRLAAQTPQLRALVLVATFARSPVPSLAHLFARETLFAVNPPAFAVRAFMVGRDADLELVQEVRAAIAKPSAHVMAARLRETLKVDVTRELESLAVPTLLLRPTRDRLVLRPLEPVNTHTMLTRVRGPHLLLQRHPRRCATLVDAFLRDR